MKIKILFISLLLISMKSQAQDVTIIDVVENSYNTSSIDTLQIKSGKPQVFLIQIQSQNDGYSIAGDDIEKKELQKNFNSKDFNLNHITKQSYIRLENGQFIDVSDLDSSYGAVAFWNGKPNDKLKIQEGVRLSTEFVSEQLGQKKKSSYITNSELQKKEISQLSKNDNFTENSRKVMNRFLKKYSVSEVLTISGYLVLNENQTKVKTITGYEVNSKGKKIKYEQIFLNEFEQPTKVNHFGDDGKNVYYSTEFIYENGILRTIVNDDRIDKISYNDNQLFFTSDLGGGEETSLYTLKDGELLSKRILIMKGDAGYEEQNSMVEEKIEKGCVNYYINKELSSMNCHSELGKFPFTNKYTSFQDGEIMQSIEYKVTKINDSKIEIVSKNSNSTGKTTAILNSRGLVESIVYVSGNETEKMLFEYTYYE